LGWACLQMTLSGLLLKAATTNRGSWAGSFPQPSRCRARTEGLSGHAEFERELIRRERAKAKGVVMGRKPKLTHHQRQEAIARREAGESLVGIGKVLQRQPQHHQPTIGPRRRSGARPHRRATDGLVRVGALGGLCHLYSPARPWSAQQST
jgi:hypothetical protein